MKKHHTSDYIDFEIAYTKATKLIRSKDVLGLYVMISINTGLRVGDLLKLNFEDFHGDKLILIEGKTKKKREILINDNIKDALRYFQSEKGVIFKSQKNGPYRIQSINRLLKQIFEKENKNLNISSHSLRKSFGRRVYENNGRSESSLVYLSELFNHSNLRVTRRYLGIRQEELDNIYAML